MKFIKKPISVDAITFSELIEYGLNECNLKTGIPWSFRYKGHPITHENDKCYLIPTLEGIMKFTPEDMLITGVNGEIYPCKKEIFYKTYEECDSETSEKFNSFKESVKPLMLYIAENHNPHTKCIVDSDTAELVNGELVYSTSEFIED